MHVPSPQTPDATHLDLPPPRPSQVKRELEELLAGRAAGAGDGVSCNNNGSVDGR